MIDKLALCIREPNARDVGSRPALSTFGIQNCPEKGTLAASVWFSIAPGKGVTMIDQSQSARRIDDSVSPLSDVAIVPMLGLGG